MRAQFIHRILILLPLLLAACGDLPTGTPAPDLADPAAPAQSESCSVAADGKTIICPPHAPDWGDECDEYHFDCGGEDCISSGGSEGDTTIQSCPGYGGDDAPIGDGGAPDGPGGSSGGSSDDESGDGPICPDSGCAEPDPEPSPETASTDDQILADSIPNCNQPQTLAWARAYCRSSPPTGARADSVRAALNRIERRGEECAIIAAAGRRLLAGDSLRLFIPEAGDTGGWADPEMGVLLPTYWVDQFASTPTTDNRNLDLALAHEIDHYLRRPDHVDAGGYDTINSRACSGLSGTSP